MLNSSNEFRQQNLDLKKKINEQNDAAKKLQTRIQRLEQELKKSAKESYGVTPKDVSMLLVHNKRLEDLESQLHSASKANSTLKQRLLQYQTLLDSAPQKKKTAPRSQSKKSTNNHVFIDTHAYENSDATSRIEELERLHELVDFLRRKLDETEQEKIHLETELKNIENGRIKDYENLLLKADIEKISLQKQLQEYLSSNDVDGMKRKLAVLESRNSHLENEVANFKSLFKDDEGLITSGKSLKVIIDDINSEKEFISKEYARLLALSRENPELVQRDRENNVLKEKLASLQRDIDAKINKIQVLEENNSFLRDRVKALETNEIEYSKIKSTHEEMLRRMDGKLDMNELEDAIILIRLLKQRNLDSMDEIIQFITNMTQYQIDHLKCLKELEEVKELLSDQDRALTLLRNEKELLLKQMNLLKFDLETLKKDKNLGVFNSDDLNTSINESDAGDNFIEIKVESAKLDTRIVTNFLKKSSSSLAAPHSKANDITDPSKYLITFISIDFANFVSQLSSFVKGTFPKYNFTSRFNVRASKDFVQKIGSFLVKIDVFRCFCGRSLKIGHSRFTLFDFINNSPNFEHKKDLLVNTADGIELGYVTVSVHLDPIISNLLKSVTVSTALETPMHFSIEIAKKQDISPITDLSPDDRNTLTQNDELVENQVIQTLEEPAEQKQEALCIDEPTIGAADEYKSEIPIEVTETSPEIFEEHNYSQKKEISEEFIHEPIKEDIKRDFTMGLTEEPVFGTDSKEMTSSSQIPDIHVEEEEENDNLEDVYIEKFANIDDDVLDDNAEIKPAVEKHTIVPLVSIHILSWNIPSDENTQLYLKSSLKLSQLFAAYEFMHLPLEDLESDSMEYDGNATKIEFNFEKSMSPLFILYDQKLKLAFDFSSIESGLKFQRYLEKSGNVKFVLVSEPQDGDETECIDFAEASFNMTQLLNNNTDVNGGDSRTFNLEMKGVADVSSKNVIPLGHLEIKISGVEFIKEIYELFDTRDTVEATIRKDTVVKDLRIDTQMMKKKNMSMSNLLHQPLPLGSLRNLSSSARNLAGPYLPISGSFAKLNSGNGGGSGSSGKQKKSTFPSLSNVSTALAVSALPSNAARTKAIKEERSQDVIDDLVGKIFQDSKAL